MEKTEEPPKSPEQDKLKKIKRRSLLIGAAGGVAATAAGGLFLSKIGNGVAIAPNGFSRARPIATDTALVKKVDVAIVGGGILGVSAALELARRGVSVAVFEKGVVAGEASGRSVGMIQAQLLPAGEQELIELAKQRWRELPALTGEDMGLVEAGTYTLFENDAGLAGAEAWLDSVRGGPNGGARMLSSAEAMAHAPGCRIKLAGGLVCTTDMGAEPVLAAPGVALGARKLGAKIYQFCAVRKIELTGGRVSAVLTERGRVEASTVILAGGNWLPLMARDLGLDIPAIQIFSKVTALRPFGGPGYGSTQIIGSTAASQVGWRKQADGGYTIWDFNSLAAILPDNIRNLPELLPALQANAEFINPRFNFRSFWEWMPSFEALSANHAGPFEKTRIYDSELPTGGQVGVPLARLQKVMPAFRPVAVQEQWTGIAAMMADNRAMLSRVDALPGLIIGAGITFGLTGGPGAGIILADIAMNQRPPIDIKPFRYSRFSDGSPVTFNM